MTNDEHNAWLARMVATPSIDEVRAHVAATVVDSDGDVGCDGCSHCDCGPRHGFDHRAMQALLADDEKMIQIMAAQTAKLTEARAEINRLAADMHSGHTLVPHATKQGWLSCLATNCAYETPMLGACTTHGTIDACWAAVNVAPIAVIDICDACREQGLSRTVADSSPDADGYRRCEHQRTGRA
jgi:hypothetical protein